MRENIYMSNYQCLEDRVLIRPIKKTEPEKTTSGIITDMAKKEVLEGEVINVGGGRYAGDSGVFIPTILHSGDIVLYGANQGLHISIENGNGKEDVVVMREGDILLLIKKSE